MQKGENLNYRLLDSKGIILKTGKMGRSSQDPEGHTDFIYWRGLLFEFDRYDEVDDCTPEFRACPHSDEPLEFDDNHQLVRMGD